VQNRRRTPRTVRPTSVDRPHIAISDLRFRVLALAAHITADREKVAMRLDLNDANLDVIIPRSG
jgi:hypothetical protein